MAASGFSPYHHLWPDDAPAECAGITPTPWSMMHTIGFVSYHQAQTCDDAREAARRWCEGRRRWQWRMKRWERRRADADNDGRDEEAPVAGGDALGRRPRLPHGGEPSLDLTGGRDDPPGGATGVWSSSAPTSTVKATRRTQHPSRRRRCCCRRRRRRRRRHPPSRRWTSWEV